MKKLSLFIYTLFILLIAALIYMFNMQNSKCSEYIKNSKEEIASLKDKVKSLEQKLKAKEQKKVINKDKNISKKEEIPKDALIINVPKVPKVTAKVPKVVTIGGSQIKPQKETHLSMDMPKEIEPQKSKIKKDSNDSKKEIKVVGLEEFGRISTYLRGKLDGDVKEQLKKAGFKILATKPINSNLESIVFTNSDLEDMGKKSAFIGNLRLLVDKKNKTITIQNPIYFAKAFMQDSYDDSKAKKVLTNINRAFSNLKPSKDKLKSTLLPKYQFMFGMPYYKDMIIVAKAKNSDELVAKIDKNAIAFKQKLDKNSYIIGVNLGSSIESFVNKIGTNNAALLPYPIMVKNGEAKILDPKYYIAISYPMLKMSQFMSISSVPDAIEEKIKSEIKWKS